MGPVEIFVHLFSVDKYHRKMSDQLLGYDIARPATTIITPERVR